MTDAESLLRGRYRIISEPSWQVQKFYHPLWHTVFYCSNEESAKQTLEKCIYRAMRPETYGGLNILREEKS